MRAPADLVSAAGLGVLGAVRCGSKSLASTLVGRDLTLLEAVLEVLDLTISKEIHIVDKETYRSFTYFNGICIVKVVPTPTELRSLIDPPIRPANW